MKDNTKNNTKNRTEDKIKDKTEDKIKDNMKNKTEDKSKDKSKDKSEDIETDTKDNIVIGIDLGTRFSCVSIWKDKKFEIIPDQFGNRTIPSVVAFYRSAKLVGHNALSMKDVDPSNTIYDVKRIIGRRADDPAVHQVQKLVSYKMIDDETEHHNILIELDKSKITHKSTYRPEEICSKILIEIRKMASNYLRTDVKMAVITVPAYFNDAQRQATLDAAKIAGLEVLKMINEPTAAALAYGIPNIGGKVIIYDLGAGTLDVSLMNISNGVFQTLAVSGNTHLGGEDIDYLLMNHCLLHFKTQHKIREIKISKLAQLKLKNAAENAKKILSTTDKAVICVDDFFNGKQLYHVITREFFQNICNELFIMCIKPLSDVLESASVSKNDIEHVVLVGGSSRIPKIQKLILDFFKNTKIKRLTMSLNPDEVVSAGASIYGYIMTHKEDPFSQNLVLLDITPLSLGVETLQKQMTVIIPRNTVIPTKKTKIFSTDTDDQDMVTIKIFEGERKLTKNNFHIGTFNLTSFEKGPRGYPVIRITFHMDINGILQVTAHEKKSDVQNSIIITSTWAAKGRLSKIEIDGMIDEARVYDQIDTMYSIKIGLCHKINTICNSILLNLRDDAFKLSKVDKRKIRSDVKNNLKWLADKEICELPVDELEKRNEHLSKTYAPLIVMANKAEANFEDQRATTSTMAAEVHGDDDDNEDIDQYQRVKFLDDPSDYDKEEIKALKKTISDLSKNILSVVNNPVSKFIEEDIVIINDYLGSVHIWLYTTSASTTIEFIAKINEINKFTEDIMVKYQEKSIFEQNDNFSAMDELHLTCLTLNTSLKSNFFSIKEDDVQKLTKMINETMFWMLTHQNEDLMVYKEKLHKISDLCNNIYDGMHRMKILETVQVADPESDSDSDSDSEPENKIPEKNQIDEKIDSIINKMPDKGDVLLKIDINKLNSKTLKYKTSDCQSR